MLESLAWELGSEKRGILKLHEKKAAGHENKNSTGKKSIGSKSRRVPNYWVVNLRRGGKKGKVQLGTRNAGPVRVVRRRGIRSNIQGRAKFQ